MTLHSCICLNKLTNGLTLPKLKKTDLTLLPCTTPHLFHPGIDRWDCEVIPEQQQEVAPNPNTNPNLEEGLVSHNMSSASFACRNCVREHGNVWVDIRSTSFAEVVMDALKERNECLRRI